MLSEETQRSMLDLIQKLSEQLSLFESQMHAMRVENMNSQKRLAALQGQLDQIIAERREQRVVNQKTREFLETADKVLRKYL